MNIRRGDIFYADLSPVVGSEQGGERLVAVIQNDIGNQFSPTVIVAAITSQIHKAKLPTHVPISKEEYPIKKSSVILAEQLRTIDKKRLQWKATTLHEETMEKLDKAIEISLGLIGIHS